MEGRPAFGQPSVPQEIIEQIIDELSDSLSLSDGWPHYSQWRQRIRNLQTCSQVSRSFRYRAQRHLFSDVRVVVIINQKEDRSHFSPAKDLWDLLSAREELLDTVRTFRLILDARLEKEDRYTPSQVMIGNAIYDTYAAKLLSLLPNVDTLITNIERSGNPFGWPQFNDALRIAFLDLLRKGNLKTLEVGPGVLLPKTFICKISSLKCLRMTRQSLGYVDAKTPLNGDEINQQRRPQLNSLSVWAIGHDRDDSEDIFMLSRGLKDLHVQFGFTNITRYADETLTLIERASETLEDIRLENLFVCYDFSSSIPKIADVTFSNLHRVIIEDDRLRAVEHLSANSIAGFVTRLAYSSPILEEISLSLGWSFKESDLQSKEPNTAKSYEERSIELNVWAELDGVLAMTTTFQRLQINLKFMLSSISETRRAQDIIDHWKSGIAFPTLSLKQGVTISLSIDIS